MISLTELTRDILSAFQHDILYIEQYSFPTPWEIEAFVTELDRPMSHVWIAEEDRNLAGYICFWIVAREIHLMNIAVHPGRRRRGVGSRLLGKMKEIGKGADVREISLEVRPSNKAARAFYLQAGFQETGRRRRYYDDTREDALIMALSV